MKIILALALALSPILCLAESKQLVWDEVTKDTAGNPAGPVIYRVYVKKDAGPFLFLASKILTSYTWTAPSLQEYFFVVRAMNKHGESADSNVLHLKAQCSWSVAE